MFAIKLCGVVIIVAASTFIGFCKSRALTSRSKKLTLLLDGINNLYENIEQGGCELDKAVKSSFEKCDFLSFKNGKCICEDNDLTNDKAYIEEFFQSLGFSVKKAECERINAFVIKLKNHIKDAENDVAQKCKVYQAMGICVGLTIAILLI